MKLPSPSKRLHNLTITQRLAALFVVLMGSFALLAMAYLGFVFVNNAAIDEETRITGFGFAVDRIKSDMLQARREEKDFLAKPDDTFLERHAKAMASAYTHILKAEGLAPDDDMREILGNVRSEFKAYQDTFKAATEVQRQVGYDENSGLHGQLREAVHAVEDVLNQHEKVDLTASMLMMRRHEKDFIQRRYDKYIPRMAEEQARFAQLLGGAGLPAEVRSSIGAKMQEYHRGFLALAEGYKQLAAKLEASNESVRRTEPRLDQLEAKKTELLAESRQAHDTITGIISWSFAGLLLLITVAVYLMLKRNYRSITAPLNQLRRTVGAIAEGDLEARAELTTSDEMQELGDAIDSMMDERGRFMQTEQENEALNNSIMSILRAVSRLGKGDLTTEAPVNVDITGALGDAINQMSDGIARTLANVNSTSAQVVAGSQHAREATAHSRETVLNTVRGMNDIRTTIQETAKRIKRLGERSQEISGIVKLIDTIAERTNVLALNANMQAAQAGEAGRGFMVVAAEVQRLAESAKEATDQIAKLISGIQVETGEAISTMDRSIEEVVEGSQLAEKGAAEMNLTDEAVEALNALGAQLQAAVRAFKLPAQYVAEGGTSVSARAAAA